MQHVERHPGRPGHVGQVPQPPHVLDLQVPWIPEIDLGLENPVDEKCPCFRPLHVVQELDGAARARRPSLRRAKLGCARVGCGRLGHCSSPIESTCQMVAVSHKKIVATTMVSSACPLLPASPISPVSSAIAPSTVVTLRKIRPWRACGLVCRSAAAITAQAAPRTSSTALAAHAVENSTRFVPNSNETNPITIAATMADDAMSRQVNPTANTSRSMGAATGSKSALKTAPAGNRGPAR